jgi:8-oxo-dGTP pyrophosphatase MutT (NUDIX family)
MPDDLSMQLAAVRDRLVPAPRLADADRDARRQAAVATIVRPVASGAGLELLLILRADREGDVWSGQVGLPGGRREDADADLIATAVREVHEEVGVDLGDGELLGALPRLEPMNPALPPISVQPFVWLVDGECSPSTSDEVAAVTWVSIDHLRDEANALEHRFRTPDGNERAMPAIHVGQVVPLWGMTHRIVDTLLVALDRG